MISFFLFKKDYPTLFLYLILTFEKTNQTQYLKSNYLSTVIIDQAIWRSRIRQPHPPTNIKPQSGEESPFVSSPFVLFNKDCPKFQVYIYMYIHLEFKAVLIEKDSLLLARYFYW